MVVDRGETSMLVIAEIPFGRGRGVATLAEEA